MPRLETSRRITQSKNNGAKTIGQIYKEESDWYMEATWDNDIQSKICYIYDYFHDDQPKLNTGMTYRNTTKTKNEVTTDSTITVTWTATGLSWYATSDNPNYPGWYQNNVNGRTYYYCAIGYSNS